MFKLPPKWKDRKGLVDLTSRVVLNIHSEISLRILAALMFSIISCAGSDMFHIHNSHTILAGSVLPLL